MTTIFIQARLNSKRLNNKIFKKINDIPIIEWVNYRVKQIKNADEIIFLIPENKSNLYLKNYLIDKKIDFFTGPENNVLKRFFLAAKKYNAKKIVRICCDNPFICPKEIEKLISFFLRNRYDYAFNHKPLGNDYPDGLGAEIVNFSTLKRIYRNAIKQNHKEHIFNYILDNYTRFKIGTFNASKLISKNYMLKLDIDTLDDLKKFDNLNISPLMSTCELIEKFKRKNY